MEKLSDLYMNYELEYPAVRYVPNTYDRVERGITTKKYQKWSSQLALYYSYFRVSKMCTWQYRFAHSRVETEVIIF